MTIMRKIVNKYFNRLTALIYIYIYIYTCVCVCLPWVPGLVGPEACEFRVLAAQGLEGASAFLSGRREGESLVLERRVGQRERENKEREQRKPK